MTDKEFLALLMLFQDGKVPLLDVGLALANNQFSSEMLGLANNILIARKEKSKVGRPQTIPADIKESILMLRGQGMTLEAIAQQAKCSLSTVRRTLEHYQPALD